MQLHGMLTDTNFEELKGNIDEAKKVVKDVYNGGVSAKVLFDLTDFSGTYNVPSMLAFKELEAHNRPFVKKTALFGGSMAARVAAELTLELIGQDNLKIFKTRDEAHAWLNS